jgi:hypothetical protein
MILCDEHRQCSILDATDIDDTIPNDHGNVDVDDSDFGTDNVDDHDRMRPGEVFFFTYPNPNRNNWLLFP